MEAAQEKQTGEYELIGIIPRDLWRIIIKNKIRGLVLLMARELEFDALLKFIKEYDSG